MSYYVSPFGNGVAEASGGNVEQNVHNQFGPRDTGGTVGVLKVEGITEQLIINFSGEAYNDIDNVLVPQVLPAGAIVKHVYVDVEVAFALTGTTPALEIGTEGSEATNGFTVSEAILEATGTESLTAELSGTWDETPLAADTTIGFALSGTTPTISDAGKARFTIIYDRPNLGL